MINENKDTIHVSLKEFNNHCKYIIDNFFEGDSIYCIFMIIKDGLMFL